MDAARFFEQILEAAHQKTVVWPLTSHLAKKEEQDMLGTAGEVNTNS